MTGSHFRDYHPLLDEQADQLFGMSDIVAERTRKVGEQTIHSVGEIARLQRLPDSDSEKIVPTEMLRVLRDDNDQLSSFMRDAHVVCKHVADLATASFLEKWIDETEQLCWFLSVTLE